jgi:hypothetical protein
MDHVQGPELLGQLAEALQRENHDPAEVEVAVFPPFTSLSSVQDRCQKSSLPIACGGQDLSPHDSGAYTGDTSGQFLARIGCRYVLVGHSERRTVHNESDNIVRDKVQAAYGRQLVPVLCVGEDLAIRRADKHVQHTLGQLRTALEGLTEEQLGPLAPVKLPVRTMRRRCAMPSAAKSPTFFRGGSCRSTPAVRRLRQGQQCRRYTPAARCRRCAGGRGEPECCRVCLDRRIRASCRPLMSQPRVMAAWSVG